MAVPWLSVGAQAVLSVAKSRLVEDVRQTILISLEREPQIALCQVIPLRLGLRALFVASLGVELGSEPSVTICGGHPDGFRLPLCELSRAIMHPVA